MQAALDQDFLFLLYDVARTMRTRADQRARARGMTRAQWVILAHLERQPGLTQNELAAIVEVEPITIGRLVDRLEARELVVRIGKEPITVNDAPGFATSRLGVAIGLEAMRMFEDGVASAADIDKAMELGYRHPMGPLRLSDLIGLDTMKLIADSMYDEYKDAHYAPPPLLQRMVEAGQLGKKTGKGFYTY